MNALPLALVSFARPEVDAAIGSLLGRLGYTPLVLAPERIGDGLGGTLPGALVLLLGAGRDLRERIHKVLDRTRPWPTLGMLVEGESGWDPELTERCCDCIRWPCTEAELAFRLGRLCRGEPARGGEGDALLWETLAELNLIGRSPAFRDAMGRVRRMVDCEAPVLIEGETGTGKELVARAIHYLGARAGGPFVPVNCGALPDHLVENELFGHERGAYTDAKAAAPGAIGEAVGGTLFLDEVEALSPKAQAALLRFLQDREYRPLGARRALRSDARVVAASNADLRALAEGRGFRPDLYFRLDILSVTLPPLRARDGDLEILASHFIEHYCRQYGLERLRLDPRCLGTLRAYGWPGNVRELENLVHRSVLLASGPTLSLRPGRGERGAADPETVREAGRVPVGDSPPEPPGTDGADALGPGGFAAAKARAIESFERAYLTRLMEETGGNVTQAARRAEKERRALGKLLKKYAIRAGVPDR